MKVRAILNPRAGLGARRALRVLGNVRDGFGRIDVRTTEHPGQGAELAREASAAGYDLVLSVGGDGTANEVAQGLLGTKTPLGLVPAGSGNGLARTLGLPLEAGRALAALEAGVVRRMDVGWVNDRPFLNVAGAGFDALVGAQFHKRGEAGGRRGLWGYISIAMVEALGYRSAQWTLATDAGGFGGRAFIVAFLNGRQYGGGAVVAPRALLNDGALDVVVFEDAPLPELLLNAPRLFLGAVEGFRRYRHLAVAEATLQSMPAFLHHRDGEPEEDQSLVRVRVEPRALRILVPRATLDDPSGAFLPSEHGE